MKRSRQQELAERYVKQAFKNGVFTQPPPDQCKRICHATTTSNSAARASYYSTSLAKVTSIHVERQTTELDRIYTRTDVIQSIRQQSNPRPTDQLQYAPPPSPTSYNDPTEQACSGPTSTKPTIANETPSSSIAISTQVQQLLNSPIIVQKDIKSVKVSQTSTGFYQVELTKTCNTTQVFEYWDLS
ncbi:hypothetical protein BOX15_Mlig012951g3 [Macrostomum lignano]|uniref:Uncharacterized protein n=1 Tax=Macrostomum lignano TaxID=282301 RepID=A0A267H232_9PLAT|nr:hypothetical protein BOX15_Mlig012951g3 [Macrostomum lignano]